MYTHIFWAVDFGAPYSGQPPYRIPVATVARTDPPDEAATAAEALYAALRGQDSNAAFYPHLQKLEMLRA